MSVFFNNDCPYEGCCKTLLTLNDLIIHIEREHIDFDSYKIGLLEEEKPECVPLSYVQKFSRPDDPSPRYCTKIDTVTKSVIENSEELNEVVALFNNNNYTICDLKDRKGGPNPSKTAELKLKEEFTPDLLGHMNNKLFTLDNSHKKPFACNMPGCQKRYKNVNGIKYHYKNYHKFNSAPILKKSLLKHKQPVTRPKCKMERHDLQGLPLLSLNPQAQMSNEFAFRGLTNMARYDETELGLTPEYFYKFGPMPGPSEFHVSSTHQVPLPNISFNYYSSYDSDMDDFSGKTMTNFVMPHFDK